MKNPFKKPRFNPSAYNPPSDTVAIWVLGVLSIVLVTFGLYLVISSKPLPRGALPAIQQV